MADLAKRAATYADLVAASDHLIAEVIFGRLVTHRRGDPRHNRTDIPFSLDLLWRFNSPSTGASLTADRTKD